jgi:hypothetical protein
MTRLPRRLLFVGLLALGVSFALAAEAATVTTYYPNSPLPGFYYSGSTIYSLPSQTLSANSYSINLGDSVTLTWSDLAGQDNIAPNQSHGYNVTDYIALCSSTGFSMPNTLYSICDDLECNGGNLNMRDSAPFTAAAQLAVSQGRCTWQCYDRYPEFVPSNSGSVAVTPSTTTTYTYSCTNPNGTTVQSATVNVSTPAPTAAISASPSSIVRGNSSGLSFSCANSTSASIDQGVGSVSSSGGTVSVSPTSPTTYTLTCSGAGGTTTNWATVTVVPPAPTVTFTASPTTIVSGATPTLTWSSTDATSCSGSAGFATGGATSGSVTASPAPASNTTYSITCTGPSGSASQSQTVAVLGVLSASCSANPVTIYPNQGTTWTSSVSGGTGVYTYSWSGTDSLVGLSSSASKVYTVAGTKSASVLVTSGSQSKSVNCSNTVNVSSVTATCTPSPASQGIGQNVTWTVVPSGGTGSYNYSWSGSDGLSGSGASVTMPYVTAGTKSASVTVTAQ